MEPRTRFLQTHFEEGKSDSASNKRFYQTFWHSPSEGPMDWTGRGGDQEEILPWVPGLLVRDDTQRKRRSDVALFLTPEGMQQLQAEWTELTRVRRPQNLADLKQAREYGDLRENATYDIAKHEQARIEGRIRELEELLSVARQIRWTESPTRVDLGVQVTLENLTTGESVQYTVVAGEEVGVDENRLSINSPLGQALRGKRVGARVSLRDRPLRFQILALEAAPGTEAEPPAARP